MSINMMLCNANSTMKVYIGTEVTNEQDRRGDASKKGTGYTCGGSRRRKPGAMAGL
jgi:hypothetical protein